MADIGPFAEELVAAQELLRKHADPGGSFSFGTTHIQTEMQINYARAVVVMGELERRGFVSASDASGRRRIMVPQ